MKSIKLNRKSWHFALASYGTYPYDVEYYAHDICSYTHKVLNGFMKALFFIALGVFLGYCMLVEPFIWFSYNFAFWYANQNLPLIVGIVFWALLVLIGVFGMHFHYKEKRNKPKPPPSFLSLWYRSFKEKICFKVDFE